jgi:hypothetical protein
MDVAGECSPYTTALAMISPMNTATFDSLLELPRLRAGAAGPVMVTYFDGLGDLSAVMRVQQTALSLARTQRRSVGSLVIVGDGKRAVNGGDDAARGEFMRLMKEVDSYIFATGVVIASQGFGGAALRAFVSGVALAARPPYPLRVFDAFASARDWMLSQPSVSAERAALTRALDEGFNLVSRPFSGP